jgi:hypothetical protein
MDSYMDSYSGIRADTSSYNRIAGAVKETMALEEQPRDRQNPRHAAFNEILRNSQNAG